MRPQSHSGEAEAGRKSVGHQMIGGIEVVHVDSPGIT